MDGERGNLGKGVGNQRKTRNCPKKSGRNLGARSGGANRKLTQTAKTVVVKREVMGGVQREKKTWKVKLRKLQSTPQDQGIGPVAGPAGGVTGFRGKSRGPSKKRRGDKKKNAGNGEKKGGNPCPEEATGWGSGGGPQRGKRKVVGVKTAKSGRGPPW